MFRSHITPVPRVSRKWRRPRTPEPPRVQKNTSDQEKNGHQRVAGGVHVMQVSLILFSASEFVSTSIASISWLFSLCSKEFSIYYWSFAFDVLFICNFRLNWGFFLLVWAALRARDSFILGVKRIITGHIFAQLFSHTQSKAFVFHLDSLRIF